MVKRREFLSNLDIGEDWVMPLPASESKPFAFVEHAKRFRAPEFPPDAKLTVSAVNAKTRGGKSKDGKESIRSERKPALMVVAPPAVADDKARLFKLEFTAETADGKKLTKLTLPIGYNHSIKHKSATSKQTCYFQRDELGTGDIRFTVTPINCFGARGKPLSTVMGGSSGGDAAS